MPQALDRHLPGFYWDQSKNRYFPSKSQSNPKSQPKPDHILQPRATPLPGTGQSSKKRRDVVLDASEKLQTTCSRSQQQHASHAILCSQVASTSRVDNSHIPVYGTITTFCTTTVDGCRHSVIGDSLGWLYSFEESGISGPRWLPEFNIQPSSEVSSICMSGSRFVATSSGASCKFLFRDLNSTRQTFILDLHRPGDIWSSHLQDRSLVLGVHMMATYLEDIEVTLRPRHLNTQSDVFAVHQQENLVFTGSRNGSIHRFDLRMDKPHGQKLFDTRFDNHEKASVRHLSIIHEWQLLASHANGDLGTFDLRFPRESVPLMMFSGHVNSMTSHTPRLGITVDPSENLLFAAGQDCRIRAWSLRTGKPLHAPYSSSSHALLSSITGEAQTNETNPLRTSFNKPVVALQVTEEREGMCLWAASDDLLHRYDLGQRAEPGVVKMIA